MPNQVQTGPQAINDGMVANARGDNQGSTVVQQYGGKYAELVRRGLVFTFSTPSQAILITHATAGSFPTLWNPLGSGRMLYILGVCATWISGTTTVSSLHWCYTANAGNVAATGAPVHTYTAVAGLNALVGSTMTSSMRFSPTTQTYTAAPAFLRSSGINLPTASALNTVYRVDYDGDFAVLPGNAVSLTCAVATTTSVFFPTIITAEVPLPAGVL